MKNNNYLSRYNGGETHYRRTDPWKHVPWDVPQPKSSALREAGIFIGCIALIIVLNVVARM